MLKEIYKLDFEIELITGLHIGGSSDSFDIGGADSTVIKDQITNEPYIPGSSIKGKLRSLLTQKEGLVNETVGEDGKSKFKATLNNNPEIRSIFEPVQDEENAGQFLVSRAIFRDAHLTEESKKNLENHLGGKGNYTEIKAENSIDLLSSKAANPRLIERVPAGAKFNGQIVLQIFDGDNAEALQGYIRKALTLLEENNYLGASGTRGYGRVKFSNKEFKKVDI